jgi:omega-6 fatty acid desaturase (delta-12 desaturase)
LLISAPAFAQVSSTTAVLLGFVLPFLVFQGLLASALYINHTHPDIPWFNAQTQPRVKLPAESLTLHLRFPAWFAGLAHHFYDHPAHHIYPAIPCYELGRAQAYLNRILGARALVVDFSFGAMADIVRKCKLYDYQNHRWLDYRGRPTTPVARTILESQDAAEHVLN